LYFYFYLSCRILRIGIRDALDVILFVIVIPTGEERWEGSQKDGEGGEMVTVKYGEGGEHCWAGVSISDTNLWFARITRPRHTPSHSSIYYFPLYTRLYVYIFTNACSNSTFAQR